MFCFFKSGLNCIISNEQYQNCCIIFELNNFEFGKNIKEVGAFQNCCIIFELNKQGFGKNIKEVAAYQNCCIIFE